MVSSELIDLLHENIEQALADYGAHTSKTEVLDDVSDDFIERLAEDAAFSKESLREMLRRSPAWNEQLQALVINGTRTHDPNFERVRDLAFEIFNPYTQYEGRLYELGDKITRALGYFFSPNADEDWKQGCIDAINDLAPDAYKPHRKKSRVFKQMCDALGVTDESKGSDFQRLFAQLADEMSSKKIDFKLFVSINPAHFLTMSNPKCDNRGTMLTSCHSFNSTEYQYNNGCTGYARDNVTMIAFTVADPTNAETLNNRKTSRQLFMYKVGNGLLLQSRMYDANGGTRGTQKDSGLYRDLVQREISECEGVPNLWKTHTYVKSDIATPQIVIPSGDGFGGYTDWTYSSFAAKISIREDHKEDYHSFEVGRYGLCIKCADLTSEGLYCDNCRENLETCEDCEERVHSDDLCMVHGSDGYERYVCVDCRDSNYSCCECCGEYYPTDDMHETANGNYVCTDCRDEHYKECEECGELYDKDDMHCAIDRHGYEVWVCDECSDNYYETCPDCGTLVHSDKMCNVADRYNEPSRVCDSCRDDDYIECENCREYYHDSLIKNGLCPECREHDEEE